MVFLAFYAILRAFTVDFILPAKLWGVLAMFASILLLFFLTWLDRSPIRSTSYRPVYRIFFWVLVADIILLGLCGVMPGRAAVDRAFADRGGLFLALPDHPAAGLQVREAAAAPQQHLAKRASWEAKESRPYGLAPSGPTTVPQPAE
jgi:ubiquinol-cytochrome c reductase cytochrome b subunit